MKKLIFLTLSAAIAVTVSACGGGGGGGGSTTIVTTPPSPTAAAKFGPQFSADISASANASPAVVSTTDVPAPDPTASPTAVN